MARQLEDAHRSLARYISSILGDEWDVWSLRTRDQEGRPYAVVKPVQIPGISARSKQIVDVSQAFIVYIYPDVADSALKAQIENLRIEELLFQAFFVQTAHRIPLFDYTTGGPAGAPIPPDEPGPNVQEISAYLDDGTSPAGFDYLRVREYQINPAQDLEDERRWSITLTVRLAWRRHGRLISGSPVTQVTANPATP